METIDKIKDQLIEKILLIKNETFLKELDIFLSNTASSDEKIIFSDVQKELLRMSFQDIEEGKAISHEELEIKVNTWLERKS
ncbi:hypothetical protein Belba_2321 [Belliella baltica DSM 15883]|uniref:Addiction module component n=1 Tax=Belliella baltica (strain DSM 15883 / CIP 108006 / LMG 21964 / BA134) TaxID=866536 RepID=I3Z6L6_BELBD|nr:hypothetical protein [Belliella baltica]AFL84884.1 hypothetical protein Belba_2321 [Belliella baltica DSM 15883]